MKYIYRLIHLIICLLSSHVVLAQEMKVESPIFDFGTIAEDGGVVSHGFTYRNVGDKPLVIVAISTSCGCTTPEYSREPLAAGASSSITVTYDPMDRPGAFSRSVSVVVAGVSKVTVLTVKGDVAPRQKSIEEVHPFEMGSGLRLSSNYYAMSHIGQGTTKESVVKYVNMTDKSITLSLKPDELSGFCSVEPPAVIAAGQQGSFPIRYSIDADANHYGVISDKYEVFIDGKRSRFRLIATANAVDDFSDVDNFDAASCSIDNRFLKFAETKKGRQTKRLSFTIENLGTRELIIRSVQPEANTYVLLDEGSVIKPGARLKVEAWVDTSDIVYGDFSRYITIIVNDPEQPVQRVRVTGKVVK